MSTHICRKIVSEKAPLPTTPGNRWDTAQTINISVRGKSPKKKKKKENKQRNRAAMWIPQAEQKSHCSASLIKQAANECEH